MPYGILKVDQVTFTNAGVDQTISVSGIVASISGNITATGTISGDVIRGGTLVSGATVTGTAGQFGTITGNTAGFTTVTGTTITGTTAQFTTVTGGTAGFTTLTGTTVTGTTANFVTVSGTTVSGNTGQFATVTGGTAGFTTVTGTTITGTTLSVASGTFTGNSTAAAFIPTGSTVPTNGVYLPAANSVAVATNGTGRLFVDSSGRVGVGTSPAGQFHVKAATDRNLIVNTNIPGDTRITAVNDAGNANVNLALQGDNVYVAAGGSERLRITSAGLVGIGTSSPSYALDCRGAVVSGNGTIQTALSFSTRSEIGSVSNHSLGFLINGTTQMLLDTSGRLGIGSTVPNEAVTIATSTSASYIQICDSSTGSTSGDGLFVGSFNGAAEIKTKENAALAFGTNNTERGRWTSDGKFLVGTSSSRQVNASIAALQFQIEGTTYQSSSMSLVTNQNAADGSYIVLGKSRGTTLNSSTIVNSGDILGALWFCGADGNTMPRGAIIEALVDGTPGANDMPGRLVFSTTADGAASPTEHLRIDKDGWTNVYHTTDGFQSRSSQGAGTTWANFASRHSATATTNGTISFLVWTNGDVQNTNNSYGAISDIKLKENIVDAASQWSDIKALQVRKYNFKEGQTHTQIGLVAQEVELVSPGLVTESPDRDDEGNELGTVTKSVNYSVLYMKAVKALQEAMERIEVLEQRLTDAGIA